jgi:lysophospholipase L1-like esterase
MPKRYQFDRLSSRFAAVILTVVAALFSGGIARADEATATQPATDPAAHAIKVACVGDSITYGATIKDRAKDSYPSQLGRLLGSGWQVRNFGSSGSTLLKKGDRPYDQQKQYAQAMAYKPEVVVIMLGTNDSKPQNWPHKDDFVADYKALIAAFRDANPDVKVNLCLPVPAFPGKFGIREEIIGPEIVPLVRQVAEETHSNVIDLHTALSGHGDVFPDTIHPNADGAALMAKAVDEALTGTPAPATQP